MDIGLGTVQTVKNNIEQNTAMMEIILKKADERHVELVLFGETFLQGHNADESLALEMNSVGIFKLKLLAINYGVPFGVGFYEKVNDTIVNAYLVLDAKGEILVHHRQGEELKSFMIGHQMFTLCVGNEGFELDKKVDGILLWPVFNTSTPKEWFNSELSKYREQANQSANESVLVNSFMDEVAYGGAFHLLNNQFLLNQPMEQMGFSIVDGKGDSDV